MEPIALKGVRIDDGFWSPRQEINRTVTIPHQLGKLRETGTIANLEAVASTKKDPFRGLVFNDSDVYKWAEAASHSLGVHPDPELDRKLDEVIEIIAAAQQPDGYLNSHIILAEPDKRWRNLGMLHELYTAGHLIEAGAAHYEATGKRSLIDVAARFADYIDEVFGPGRRDGIPGHEEIELALVGLHRATGEPRYFELARAFIDRRGRRPSPFEKELEERDLPRIESNRYHLLRDGAYDGAYLQDHLPVRDQTEVVGHAVRAMYLFTGMAEVARETGDQALIDAMERLWQNLTLKRMYVTAGIGPASQNEGFTRDYDLPNDTAYAETCAAIGLVFWSHKLLLLHKESRFADVMELALYNCALSGISQDGERFFYVNPLESAGHHHRQEWFGCACCPPNISRLLASLGKYAYSKTDSGIWINLYLGSTATTDLPGVGGIKMAQETEYPWSGDVKLVLDTETSAEFGVNLRIPGWCDGATARVNGQESTVQVGANGYITIRRAWKPGDTVELSMPMEIQRIEARPEVRHDAGRMAFRRGPIIFCFEAVDNVVPVHTIAVPPDAKLEARFGPDLLGGVVAIRGEGLADDPADWDGRLYRKAQFVRKPVRVMAIPYFAWDNREPGSMAVWMRNG